MQKLTNLFIRACKSSEPTKNITWLYRRYYLSFHRGELNEITYKNCLTILLSICEEIDHRIDPVKLLNYISPYKTYQDDREFYHKSFDCIVNHIATIKNSDIDGFVPSKRQ